MGSIMRGTCGLCQPFQLAMADEDADEKELPKVENGVVISNMDAITETPSFLERRNAQNVTLQSIPEASKERSESDGKTIGTEEEQPLKQPLHPKSEGHETKEDQQEVASSSSDKENATTLKGAAETPKVGTQDESFDDDKARAVETLVVSVKVEETKDARDEDVETEIDYQTVDEENSHLEKSPEGENQSSIKLEEAAPTSPAALPTSPTVARTPMPASSPDSRFASPTKKPLATNGDVEEERDFDKNPTSLYCALQRKEWDKALTCLKESPHEAKIWISRKETDGRLRWRLLPIHASIIFIAPIEVVEALLVSFPDGAKAKDDQGMLPLHLSFRMGSPEEVVTLLLNSYPESLQATDRKGRTPKVLAETSNGPNKAAFLRAIKKGVTRLSSPKSKTSSSPKSKVASPKSASVPSPKSSAVFKSTADATSNVDAAKSAEGSKPNLSSEPNPSPKASASQEKALPPKLTLKTEGSAESEAKPLPSLPRTNSKENTVLSADAEKIKKDSEAKLKAMEKEISALQLALGKNQETSQVLVDHIASLEAQLNQRQDMEKYLAGKIALLDSTLLESTKTKEEIEYTYRAEYTKLQMEKKALEVKVAELKEENDATTTALREAVKNLETKKAEWSEYKSKLDHKIVTLENDSRSFQAHIMVLETQLKNRTESENLLAGQVAVLAGQLQVATHENGNSTAAFSSRVRSLEKEREDLRFSVDRLSKKLYFVAGLLDSMGKEQAKIVEQALGHESEAALAACSQADGLQHVKEEAELVEKAKQQRAEILELLNRHVESLEHATNTRKSVLQAVEEQAQLLASTSEHRLRFITGVSSLKERMSDVLDSVFVELPKEIPDDDSLVDQVLETILNKCKSEKAKKAADLVGLTPVQEVPVELETKEEKTTIEADTVAETAEGTITNEDEEEAQEPLDAQQQQCMENYSTAAGAAQDEERSVEDGMPDKQGWEDPVVTAPQEEGEMKVFKDETTPATINMPPNLHHGRIRIVVAEEKKDEN